MRKARKARKRLGERMRKARICKECVARHVENGEPWQCSVCCCWRGPAQFPTKHQKASCAFYRVCLTCKELKKCDLCDQLLEEKEFSKAKWLRTRCGQRVCTACQKRGQWTCSVCKTRRLQTHFSLWGKNHKGQHGEQQCNICIHMKRARQRTHTRLQRRRNKVAEAKVAKVLQAVRTEIQQMKRKQHARGEESAKAMQRVQQNTSEASPTEHKRVRVQLLELQKNIQAPGVEEESSHGHECMNKDTRESNARSVKRREYECPYCHVTIYSSVDSGNVQVAGHCGKQFRVRNGVVACGFAHACPTCGQHVRSAKASGRIRAKHKKPNGKTCPTADFVIK